MRQKKIFLILVLLFTMVQGAWAQASWDEVYAMTNTTEANWTALPEGTSEGATIGTAGATTYYYASKHIDYSNSTPGGSGLTILGNVYLYLPQGVTVTCTGADASGQTGAGAGIELTEGNSLFLLGKGAVKATGGDAANGGDGTNGSDASYSSAEGAAWVGGGGTGGNGGGGGGAGIGTRGGAGGAGGSAAASEIYYSTWVEDGVAGSAGGDGQTAGAMGTLYASDGITVNATGGSYGAAGTAGSAGKSYLYVGYYVYSFPGGGGGGAGGSGGAGSKIGSGGPGGGGGGGGAKGSHTWAASGFFVIYANGGGGGQGDDGYFTADGGAAGVTKANVANGLCDTNDANWVNTATERTGGDVTTTTNGGSGGAAGAACTNGSAISINMNPPTQEEWDVVCAQTNTNKSQWTALPLVASKGATIGAAGTTTYYYATGDRTFTNSNAGGSGLTILGTVHIFIASGQTITCTGANATAPTGGGAGIELAAGNTLYLIGSGKLVATGGNAANGGNGQNGRDASGTADGSSYNDAQSGDGGRGGDGGGGAGAGIGTHGGNGGAGGAGGATVSYTLKGTIRLSGNIGNNGDNGGTAADMGTLYIYQIPALTTEIHGGSGGTSSANGGAGGRHALIASHPLDGYSWLGTVGGGAGGAGGGFGGAASDIGTGGPGGGGGGGGSSGSIQNDASNTYFLQVGAFGGAPGADADGTLAGAGESTLMVDVNNLAYTNCSNPSEKENGGWGKDAGDNRAAGGSGGTAGAASTGGSANVVPAIINLADNADNSTTINTADGFLANVTLTGRTLYKDGKWNTLCLPFDVTISGSVLDGDKVDVRMLDNAEFSDGTLTLNFTDKGAVSEIEAGRPYIIKWDNTNVNLTEQDLVFQGVTIESGTTDKTCDLGYERSITFKGTYSPRVIYESGDKHNLYLGNGNTLYYPTTEGFALKSCRAYFELNGLTAGEPKPNADPQQVNVRAFSLNFGDGEQTGIVSISKESGSEGVSGAWYSLDGVRLSGKPTAKGLYIHGGRKVVVP